MSFLDEVEGRFDLPSVGFDHSRKDVVLGLEVVLDIPGGNIGSLGDLRERGPFDTLFVDELCGGSDQALSFPWPVPLNRRCYRVSHLTN